MSSVAVLFARADSVYKTIPQCDVYDIERDARTWQGGVPVIAHPPCRAWGRLRHFANPRPDEKDLAFFAVDRVRRYGGVLEHPAHSSLWPAAGLPAPGQMDAYNGWTLPVPQFWFGHRAMKHTWLYIVGVSAYQVPRLPLILGDAPCVLETSKTDNPRPSISRLEREATPPYFAHWLVALALAVAANSDSNTRN